MGRSGGWGRTTVTPTHGVLSTGCSQRGKCVIGRGCESLPPGEEGREPSFPESTCRSHSSHACVSAEARAETKLVCVQSAEMAASRVSQLLLPFTTA
jgi:hypothetical protein